MTAFEFLSTTLDPDLSWLAEILPEIPPINDDLRVLMTAISGQESGWRNVQQSGGGPGRGYFQMEPATCRLIAGNPVTEALATKVCMECGVPPSRIYDSLLSMSRIAVAFARLDLWCNPHPLPTFGDQDGAWKYYVDTWRPGKRRPLDWPKNYQAARVAVTGETK